jgi:hypothetical protein
MMTTFNHQVQNNKSVKGADRMFAQKVVRKHLKEVSKRFNTIVSRKGATASALMNPLNNTAVVLERLASAAGLHKETKNFKLITKAMMKGYTLVDILHNPDLAEIPKNQQHWIEKFLAENPLPKKLVRQVRQQVKVMQASIETAAKNEDGHVEVTAKVAKQSQSALSDAFASRAEYDPISRKMVADMTHICYVDLKVDLPEDGQMDEETKRLIELQQDMIDNGFYINGRKYVFFMQTASQARLLQAIFMAEDFMSIPDAFRALGHDFKAYAKKKGDTWVLDVTKMLKRFGLSGTSTIESRVIKFPNARIVEFENGEYKIESDLYSIYVAEDRYAIINEGKFKAFKDGEIVEFDAAEHPVTLGVGDGLLLCDEEIYWALMAEFGEKSDAWQVRLTPFGKGLMVFVPGLRKYYDANIVAFKSAVKGDFRQIIDKHEIALRIARFNKPIAQKPVYTVFPYQFTHVTSLTFEEMKSIVLPHLERTLDVLKDATLMQKYAGVAHLENMDGLSEEEQEFMKDRSIVSTFSAFMHAAPFTFQDAYMQGHAIALIRDEIRKWMAGTIPVEGHYRFMVQDPYALLEAKNYNQRDKEGRLIVPKHVGMKANTVFLFNRKGSVITDHVALFRNPAITKGEGRIVKGAAPQNYVEASKMGAFQNLCVMSCHDFNTFAMGGADNDGDECLTVTEPIIVNSLMKKNAIPVLDLTFNNGEWESGCPYGMPMEGVPSLGAACVKQDNFTIAFTEEQYTDAFINAVHELSKDFVKRTMKPNKIGFLTDIATKLADAVRKIGYMIKEGIDEYGNARAWTEREIQVLREEIARYEAWIDLLRLCQGWEIDRAKHGGAYEEQLADALAFIKNPPYYASWLNEKTGKRVWNSLKWLNIHRGKEGGANTNSVLSKLSAFICHWVAEHIDAYAYDLKAKLHDHNLIEILRENFSIDDMERVKNLKDMLNGFRMAYGRDFAILSEKVAQATDRVEVLYGDDAKKLKEALEKIEAWRKDMSKKIIDKYAALVASLEAAYSKEEIAFVAYNLVYTTSMNRDNEEDRGKGLGFVWQVCKSQMLALCSKIANRQVKLDKFVVQVADVHINFFVNKTVRDADKLAAYIENTKTLTMKYVEDPILNKKVLAVYTHVNGNAIHVGNVFSNFYDFFAGATEFTVTVTSAKAEKAKKSDAHYMYLTVSAIHRV